MYSFKIDLFNFGGTVFFLFFLSCLLLTSFFPHYSLSQRKIQHSILLSNKIFIIYLQLDPIMNIMLSGFIILNITILWFVLDQLSLFSIFLFASFHFSYYVFFAIFFLFLFVALLPPFYFIFLNCTQ